jgi:hypothetical protein
MEGLNMKTKSFSKGNPCGYQWICVLKIIACLCFVSFFCSLAGAMSTSDSIESGSSLDTDLTAYRDIG